ncbi:hypothetical protein [Macrococcoides caseolyticum]|uniref:hypothetical protein n=1 Tax=Macrococcoides caseolyticum TaxID=69966 RepID=UPI000C349B53|nr:hypothetical protein [Macrococcus caseolyticus]PKE61567.1 hypothetical protein CW669_02205 [Macrococcus caseolyticus]
MNKVERYYTHRQDLEIDTATKLRYKDKDRKQVKVGINQWKLLREEMKKYDVPMVVILNAAIDYYFSNKEEIINKYMSKNKQG